MTGRKKNGGSKKSSPSHVLFLPPSHLISCPEEFADEGLVKDAIQTLHNSSTGWKYLKSSSFFGWGCPTRKDVCHDS